MLDMFIFHIDHAHLSSPLPPPAIETPDTFIRPTSGCKSQKNSCNPALLFPRVFEIISVFFSRKERQRDKADTNSINKMFYKVSNVDGTTQYKLIEHVQNVCRLANGFIYVADAEDHKGKNF